MTRKDDKDGLGDWRIQAVLTISEDIPAAYLGGPSHKAGTPGYLVSVAKHREHRYLGFVTPNPTALALDVAYDASVKATKLRTSLALMDIVGPNGRGKQVTGENLPHLYDFFENCMMAVTFSFQSLETFANLIIALELEDKKIKIKRKGEFVEYSSENAERNLSTEEKIFEVLPQIKGISIKKGAGAGQNFTQLKKIRDATIHLKSTDVFPDPEKLDKDSLFSNF